MHKGYAVFSPKLKKASFCGYTGYPQ